MRHKRPLLGCRVRATGYYRRSCQQGQRWVIEKRVIEGIYCGERYITQGEQIATYNVDANGAEGDRFEGFRLDRDAPSWQIRTYLVALDHRRRVSVMPSDVEVMGEQETG